MSLILAIYYTGLDSLKEVAAGKAAAQLAEQVASSYGLKGKALRIVGGEELELGEPDITFFYVTLYDKFISLGVKVVERGSLLEKVMYEALDTVKVKNEELQAKFGGEGPKGYLTADYILKLEYAMKIKRKRDVDSVIVRVAYRLDDAKTGTVVGTKVVDYVYEFPHVKEPFKPQLKEVEFFTSLGYHGNLQVVKMAEAKAEGDSLSNIIGEVYSSHSELKLGVYLGEVGIGVDWVFGGGEPSASGRIAKFLFFADRPVSKSFGFRGGIGFLSYRDTTGKGSIFAIAPELYWRLGIAGGTYLELSPGFTLNMSDFSRYTSFHFGVALGYRRRVGSSQ